MRYLDHTLAAYSDRFRCSMCGLIVFEGNEDKWVGTKVYTSGGTNICISHENGDGYRHLKNLTCNEVLVRGIIK